LCDRALPIDSELYQDTAHGHAGVRLPAEFKVFPRRSNAAQVQRQRWNAKRHLPARVGDPRAISAGHDEPDCGKDSMPPVVAAMHHQSLRAPYRREHMRACVSGLVVNRNHTADRRDPATQKPRPATSDCGRCGQQWRYIQGTPQTPARPPSRRAEPLGTMARSGQRFISLRRYASTHETVADDDSYTHVARLRGLISDRSPPERRPLSFGAHRVRSELKRS